MLLENLLKTYKKPYKFAYIIQKILKDEVLYNQIKEETSFLDEQYPNVSIDQRLYHIWFDIKLEKCSCGRCKPFMKKFSTFTNESRFSKTSDALEWNYHWNCMSPKCMIEHYLKCINDGIVGLETILLKISKNKELQKFIIEETVFLNDHYSNPSIQQRFYHILFNSNKIEECYICSKSKKFNKKNKVSIKHQYGLNVNYNKTCGSSKCNNEAVKAGMLKIYGVEYFTQTEEWETIIKENNQNKYGTDWFFQTEELKDKAKLTCMKKHGVEHPMHSSEIKDKLVKTCIERYGVENPMQNPETVKKIQKTNIEKYGVPHLRHDPEFHEKNSGKRYKRKRYTFPSGRIEKVQGYEFFAIDDLLNGGFNEEDIIIGNKSIEDCIGPIWYNTADEIQHKYYPDIYVKSLNKVIEVKSEWTWKCDVEKNWLKKAAVEALGLSFEFWVYNRKGNRTII